MTDTSILYVAVTRSASSQYSKNTQVFSTTPFVEILSQFTTSFLFLSIPLSISISSCFSLSPSLSFSIPSHFSLLTRRSSRSTKFHSSSVSYFISSRVFILPCFKTRRVIYSWSNFALFRAQQDIRIQQYRETLIVKSNCFKIWTKSWFRNEIYIYNPVESVKVIYHRQCDELIVTNFRFFFGRIFYE